jgi:hypothetical protein
MALSGPWLMFWLLDHDLFLSVFLCSTSHIVEEDPRRDDILEVAESNRRGPAASRSRPDIE